MTSKLRLKTASGGGSTSLEAASSGSHDVELELPTDIGTADQVLKLTNISGKTGKLAWGSAAVTGTTGATDFTIADGNLVVAAGHGISFAATSDDGTLAGAQELFEDYEEGYFTATAANSVTFDNFSTLNYTKVGNLVHIFGILNIDSDNSNAVFYINNLPFAHGGTHPQYSVPVVHTNNWDMPANAINISGYGTSSQLRLRVDIDNGSPAQVNADSGAELFISYTYRST